MYSTVLCKNNNNKKQYEKYKNIQLKYYFVLFFKIS